MIYTEMTQIAYNAVQQRLQNNLPLQYSDTVCVVVTNTNAVYVGFGSADAETGSAVHAEMEAMNAMYASKDCIISAVSTMNVADFSFAPPCINCINAMLKLHPNNANAALLMPDNMICLGQAEPYFYGYDNAQSHFGFGANMQQNYGYQPNMSQMVGSQMVSMYQNGATSVYPQNPQTYFAAQGYSNIQAPMPSPQMQGFVDGANSAYYAEQPRQSVIPVENAYTGSMLRNKVNKLLDTDSELTEIQAEVEKPEKRKFKLFR